MATEAIEKAYADSGLPPQALAPIKAKVDEAFSLILENNKRVAQVNAAKANDPNDTTFLDSIWAANSDQDPEITKLESRYQVLVAEEEKLLKQMRELAKKQIPEQLSEEETKKTKALVNSSTAAIAKATQEAAAMASIIDSMLTAQGKAIDGGVISLMPQADSLKNLRGRKAGSGDSKPYMTRVADVLVDGKSTKNEKGQGKFNYAADTISQMWGSESVPANRVTAEEIETAFYKHIGKELRSLSEMELAPDTEFTFTKTIDNGDGKTETKSVKLNVIGKITLKQDEPKQDESAEAKPEVKTEKVEAKETEAKAPANSKAPAKK